MNSTYPVDLPSLLSFPRALPPKVTDMPIDVVCPACQQKLRVPDDLVGQDVRCQKCNSQFTAVEEVMMEVVEEDIAMEVVEEPPDAGYEVVEEPPIAGREKPPPRRLRSPDQEDNRDDPVERRQPRRKKRKRASSAPEMVYLPGLLLTIAGYVGIGINALFIVLNLFNAVNTLISSTQASMQGPPGRSSGPNVFVILVAVCIQAGITAAWGGTVVRGGQSLSSMNNYPMAMIGCIVACVPCSLGCFLGLPIGIWGLVVLCQKDVKRAFG
jgi:predicted Zn finger-like uncharacterized protein